MEEEEGEERGVEEGEGVPWLLGEGSRVMVSSEGTRRAVQGHQAWWLLMGSS